MFFGERGHGGGVAIRFDGMAIQGIRRDVRVLDLGCCNGLGK